MLSFIAGKAFGFEDIIAFKYISCYLLSLSESLTAQRIGYLNTSHVIFYPTMLPIRKGPMAFKYISCYLLSRRN